MRKSFFIIGVFLTLTSCQCEKKSSAPVSGIQVHLSKEPGTLDWHKATDIPSRTVILALMSTLTDYSFEGVKPVLTPSLALSWSSEEKGKRWIFDLREDVLWSDGVPFTADHVVESFRRLLSPKTGAFNSYYFYGIKGAKSYNEGLIDDFNKVGVKAVGDHRVEFQLNRALIHFPKLLALFNTAPWRTDFETSNEVLVVNSNLPVLGPYQVDTVRAGEWIRLRKNGNYFKSGSYEDRIEFKIIREPTTAVNLFRSGQLDIVTEIPEAEKAKLSQDPRYRQVQELSIEYLGFNMKKPPFDQLKNREAVEQKTDAKKIIDLLASGESYNPYFLPQGVGPLMDFDSVNSNLKLATNALEFTLSFPSEPKQKRVAEALQSQWQSETGWTVELEPQDWKVFLGRVNSEPPQIYRLGWMAIFPDPVLFLSLWTSNSHYNTSGWKNHSYDELVAKIEGEVDKVLREGLVAKALQKLKDQVVVIPLYRGARQELVQSEIQGYRPNSLNRPQWWKLHRSSSENL